MDDVTFEGSFCFVEKHCRKKGFMLSPLLEGSRRWLNDGRLKFENTTYNINKAKSLGLKFTEPCEDGPRTGAMDFDVGSYPRPAFNPPEGCFLPSKNKWEAFKKFQHQKEAFEKFKGLKAPKNGKYVFALFAEPGTGKTKIVIDLMNYSFCKGRISAVLLLAKKGVHNQWIEKEEIDGVLDPSPLEKFTQKDIEFDAESWKKKNISDKMFHNDGRMKWFSLNFESVITKKAKHQIYKFMEAHKGSLAVIGDETHYWANPISKRTKESKAINDYDGVIISGIMTGTPIPANLVDEYSQFRMLDDAIIGHKYLTTFKREYCVLGGYEGRQVIGSRNEERFKQLTAPYIFRKLKKDCTDLPPKQYRKINFSMTREQKAVIAQLKQTQSFINKDGKEFEWKGKQSVSTKIQEVSNGFLSHENSIIHFFEKNPRLDELRTFLESYHEKAVVWARFKQDIKILLDCFGSSSVAYYGETDTKKRKEAKEAFIDDPSVKYFLATSAAAEGLDGLQKVCSTSIYYSNNFNSIHRWQSEDRIHRIGQAGSAIYYDILAKGCIDYPLLTNLRKKTSFAEMILDINTKLGIKD